METDDHIYPARTFHQGGFLVASCGPLTASSVAVSLLSASTTSHERPVTQVKRQADVSEENECHMTGLRPQCSLIVVGP